MNNLEVKKIEMKWVSFDPMSSFSIFSTTPILIYCFLCLEAFQSKKLFKKCGCGRQKTNLLNLDEH